MKTLFAALFFLAAPASAGAPVWEIKEGLAQPESAYYDKDSGFLYISNVAGSPGEKDGKGWITKADLSGKVVAAQWVAGFNAPKGLRSSKGKLYVADIDELVEIDIASAAVVRRIPAPGAQMLNDVAVDAKGDVYVSDTIGSRIYRFAPKAGITTFAVGAQLESPNGLYWTPKALYIAAWGLAAPDWSAKEPGRLLALDPKTMAVATKGDLRGNLDGLEPWKGGWLVSDFAAGKVYRVAKDGKSSLLMEGFKGSADLGVIPGKNLLVLPRMHDGVVSAYELK